LRWKKGKKKKEKENGFSYFPEWFVVGCFDV